MPALGWWCGGRLRDTPSSVQECICGRTTFLKMDNRSRFLVLPAALILSVLLGFTQGQFFPGKHLWVWGLLYCCFFCPFCSDSRWMDLFDDSMFVLMHDMRCVDKTLWRDWFGSWLLGDLMPFIYHWAVRPGRRGEYVICQVGITTST